MSSLLCFAETVNKDSVEIFAQMFSLFLFVLVGLLIFIILMGLQEEKGDVHIYLSHTLQLKGLFLVFNKPPLYAVV